MQLLSRIVAEKNLLITSSDVASALLQPDCLIHTPAYNADLTVDDTGSTFAGFFRTLRSSLILMLLLERPAITSSQDTRIQPM